MSALVVLLLAGALPLARAQAPSLDQSTPEAVAKAYLEALANGDVEAALRCLDPGTEARGAAKLLKQAAKEAPMEQMFTEMLLLPLGKQAQYESGELLREGDTARLAVMATLEVPQTLVLRKGPDGKWVVSLTQSAKASSGREELGLLRGLDQPAPEECMTHLKQLALAVHMWAQDHDGALPSAKGWGSELQPYLGNVEVFRCPAAPELECGYSLNLEVAGKKLAAVPQPSQTVLFYESTLGRLNAADRGESEPHPGRHKGGSFRAYVDGHVEFQRPAKR